MKACKYCAYKVLGEASASQPAEGVLRKVALVLPPDLGLICRDGPRDGTGPPNLHTILDAIVKAKGID